ncbi:MAG: hypothetical protein IT334_06465, partial [Thermomicrobiales bacterium]|nr:hypothetical protein [Thermomicrobiales bacterium]
MKRGSELVEPNDLEVGGQRRPNSSAAAGTPFLGNVLPRTRLFAAIQEPYQATLTIITAPPGYGKSALASTWAAQTDQLVAWVELSPADNEPDHLLRTLHRAIDPLLNDVNGEYPRVAQIDGHDATLRQRMEASALSICVVLDCCDHLHPGPAADLIRDQLLAGDNDIRVIAIGRNPTPLQCGRLRLRDQVRALDADDLAFTLEETVQLMGTVGLESTPDHEPMGLLTRTGGWPTGEKLVALAHRDADAHHLGSAQRAQIINTYIDEYVEQSVYLPMSDTHRCAALIAAIRPALLKEYLVENLAKPSRGGRTLEPDDVEGLLVSGPTGEEERQLVPMLAESLNRISRQYPVDCSAVARWMIARQDYFGAGELALAIDDPDLVMTVGELVAVELAIRSNLPDLTVWIAKLPAEVVSGSRELSYWQIAGDMLRGHVHSDSARRADAFIAAHESDPDARMQGRVCSIVGMRAYARGNDELARTSFEAAMALLPDFALVERLHASTFLEWIAFRLGDDARSDRWQAEAISSAGQLPIDEVWSWRTTAPNRANCYALRGDIGSAISKYRLILAESPPSARPLEGFLRSRLISLLIERGELEAAFAEFEAMERQLEAAEFAVDWQHEFTLAQVRLLSAAARLNEAERIGNAALIGMRRRKEKSQLVLLLARIWVDRGDRALVRSWLEDVRAFEYPAVQVFGEVNYRELELMLPMLDGDFLTTVRIAGELIDEARAKCRVAEEITFSMRLAVSRHALGDRTGANAAAHHAIELAHRGGFLRSLMVAGYDVGTMFPDVWNRSANWQRMRHQLQNLTHPFDEHAPHGLSRREQELL